MKKVLLVLFLVGLFLCSGCNETNVRVVVKYKTSGVYLEGTNYNYLSGGLSTSFKLVKSAPMVSSDDVEKILERIEENSVMTEEAVQAEGLSMSSISSLEFTIKEGQESQLLDEIRNNPNVEEAHFPATVIEEDTIPNDTRYSTQKDYYNLIQLPAAWDKTTGSRDVIVAVVDTGVNNHPDLTANLMPGYDYVNDDGTPDDEAGHGTSVAGILGAVGNNQVGNAGISWNVRIMPMKAIYSGPNTDLIYQAVADAIAGGASIINCSFGMYTDDNTDLRRAVEMANMTGVLVVCSAGNESKDNEISRHLPSDFDYPNIISVAASNRYDELASFSNFGVYSVDLAAPGSSISTISKDGGYRSISGTSAATPFVSGTAALIKALHPQWKSMQMRNAILNTVDPVQALSGVVATGGRLNCNKSVNYGSVPPPTPIDFISIPSQPKTKCNIIDARNHNDYMNFKANLQIDSFQYELKTPAGYTLTSVEAAYEYIDPGLNQQYPAVFKDIGTFASDASFVLLGGNSTSVTGSFRIPLTFGVEFFNAVSQGNMLPGIRIRGTLRSTSGQTTVNTLPIIVPDCSLGAYSPMTAFFDRANGISLWGYSTEKPGTVYIGKNIAKGFGGTAIPSTPTYAYSQQISGTVPIHHYDDGVNSGISITNYCNFYPTILGYMYLE